MKKLLTQPDLKRKEKIEAFDRLLTMIDELRENCPWDKKQTLESLRYLTIEETFELSDAILDNNTEEIKKELGDLLLHIVFYARIGSENNSFNITSVIRQLCEKLIARHPHIYGNVTANDEEVVKRNWEQIKLKEKGSKPTTVLGGVPRSLPALIKSQRIQEKVRAVGFDWSDKELVWKKVEEEIHEFKEETDKEKTIDEFGDLLFSLINYARFVNINSEEALEKTNKKFTKRFNYLEEQVKASGRDWSDWTLEEMDVHWKDAKKL